MNQMKPTLLGTVLDKIDGPLLLINRSTVEFANFAARQLIGPHCVGQDFRLSIRSPNVVALLGGKLDSQVETSGLFNQGDAWEVKCSNLGEQLRLLWLKDISLRDNVSRAHTDFVANASHELRTPLAAILGYVETLSNPQVMDDLQTRSRFFSIIAREAERMQSLVDDLMSLSRIEAGKYRPLSGLVDLISLGNEIVGEFKDYVQVELVPEVETVVVAGDKAQLMQALRNLVDNARKYGKPGEGIRLFVTCSPSGLASVTVEDRGDGIAPEHVPRLTERFYRVDPGRSRGIGGTGLGLAIVKHIVERHRGRLEIQSVLGQGTRVTIHMRQVETTNEAALSTK